MALARTHTARKEDKADENMEPMLTGLFAPLDIAEEDGGSEETTEE